MAADFVTQVGISWRVKKSGSFRESALELFEPLLKRSSAQ
jgi:hypothetical protein